MPKMPRDKQRMHVNAHTLFFGSHPDESTFLSLLPDVGRRNSLPPLQICTLLSLPAFLMLCTCRSLLVIMIYDSSLLIQKLAKRCVIIRRESGRVGRQSACRDRDPEALIAIIWRSGAGDRPRVRRGSDATGRAGEIGPESQVR